jgi:hypothetical protein
MQAKPSKSSLLQILDVICIYLSSLLICSVVGIETGKGVDDIVQIGSGVHPTSYPMGTGALSPGLKRPGRETDHSPPASAKVKKTWVCTSTPPYTFMMQCLIN